MEIEDTSKLDISPDDIASVECICLSFDISVDLLKKTWRYCKISHLHSNCCDEDFVQELVPSIQQYFHQKIMALGDARLQTVMIHDILNVRGICSFVDLLKY